MQTSVSPHADFPDTFHSPLSLEFSQSDPAGFTQTHSPGAFLQPRSMTDYEMFTTPLIHETDGQLGGIQCGLPPRAERSMSSEGHSSRHFIGLRGSRSMFFSPMSNGDACEMSESPFEDTASPDYHSDQAPRSVSRGMPTPTDSFRSPPPPANIASRRNIPRPAALQAASLRSRSFNMPKTALDGPKRMDISSPVSSMRRISSATGIGPGRIQKSSSGPRSPMFFGRNAEALLQYTRSPVGSGTPTFSGAAPPTPMTPALFDHHSVQEPAVISSSSDDGSFAMGGGIGPHFMQELKEEHDLKTPPTTPGMMSDFRTNNYLANNFGSGFNLTTDQPLLTPYLYSEFPDLSMQHVPSYVQQDGIPSTPVFGNMMGSSLEHHALTRNVTSNTQYDWDANEAVVSSRSSPGNARSKQIQFTPNITPQDYHFKQE